MLRLSDGLRALLLILAGTVGTASAARIEGTVYNLPPTFTPITDMTVDIQVFAPVPLAGGEVERGPDGRLTNGSLLRSAVSDPAGRYNLTIPAIPGATQQIVNIVFNRRGFGITQELNGVVVEEGRINTFDVTVPLPLATQNANLCYYYIPVQNHHCGLLTRRRGLFRH